MLSMITRSIPAEVVALAGNAVHDNKKHCVIPCHHQLAIRSSGGKTGKGKKKSCQWRCNFILRDSTFTLLYFSYITSEDAKCDISIKNILYLAPFDFTLLYL
jgi:hypothetical protein